MTASPYPGTRPQRRSWYILSHQSGFRICPWELRRMCGIHNTSPPSYAVPGSLPDIASILNQLFFTTSTEDLSTEAVCVFRRGRTELYKGTVSVLSLTPIRQYCKNPQPSSVTISAGETETQIWSRAQKQRIWNPYWPSPMWMMRHFASQGCQRDRWSISLWNFAYPNSKEGMVEERVFSFVTSSAVVLRLDLRDLRACTLVPVSGDR